jgi:hypothetical protein
MKYRKKYITTCVSNKLIRFNAKALRRKECKDNSGIVIGGSTEAGWNKAPPFPASRKIVHGEPFAVAQHRPVEPSLCAS